MSCNGKVSLAFICVCLSWPTYAEEVGAPQFSVGDTFTTEGLSNGATIEKTYAGTDASGNLIFEMKRLDQPGATGREIYTPDLSLVRRELPKRTFTYEPDNGALKFPMKVGAKWEAEFKVSDGKRSNTLIRDCEVMGTEDVEPEGASPIMAFRIECERYNKRGGGNRKEELLYAPEVRWTLSVKNLTKGGGNVLQSYVHAGAAAVRFGTP